MVIIIIIVIIVVIIIIIIINSKLNKTHCTLALKETLSSTWIIILDWLFSYR